MFLRDANRNPVACVATNFDKETNKFTYQYSVVHSDDQFSKERGRQIAKGRLDTNPIEVVDPSSCNCKFNPTIRNNEVMVYQHIKIGSYFIEVANQTELDVHLCVGCFYLRLQEAEKAK